MLEFDQKVFDENSVVEIDDDEDTESFPLKKLSV